MEKMTNLQQFKTAVERFQTNKRSQSIKELLPPVIGNQSKYIVFLSIGQHNQRAKVFHHVSEQSYEKAQERVMDKEFKWLLKYQPNFTFVKLDYVTNVEETTLLKLQTKIAKYRKNYFRKGIAFDSDFSLSFLEQEVNGNAFIREAKNGVMGIDELNIRHYLKVNRYKVFNFTVNAYAQKNIYLFDTQGYFFDVTENRKWTELYSGGLANGIRKAPNLKREIEQITKKSTLFLEQEITSSGKFNYGYFSAFDKKIGTYNILRHSSSLYSMLEGYEVIGDKKILASAKKSIDYLISTSLVYRHEETAYIVDKANADEIKLGSNATAILAITKYTEVSQDKSYIAYAQHLANGILEMRNKEDGHYTHVLQYPTFDVKDKFRIIYYEGEAVFSLLRLYQIDNDKKWLDEVVDYFEIFIAEDYWKHHDHWLSYAVNELTDYISDDKYYQFGLKNCADKLDFMYHRETTFPTFLELTMAAYKMLRKIKAENKDYLLTDFDETLLIQTIDKRAEYQRVGFMYPELAMYFKTPETVLNGFFIRHHSFRVRIDDVEHNLSGYIQYLLHRIPDIEKKALATV